MMKWYLVLAASLALIIPGLARAEFNMTAQAGGLPSASSATLSNSDASTPSLSSVQPVPEPTTRALIACCLGIGFLVLSRKHAKKS